MLSVFLNFVAKTKELTFGIASFSLCLPNLLLKFTDRMQDEWELAHAGYIGYLNAIAELADFRKVNGPSDVVLRGCLL